MKFFIDTANLEQIREAQNLGILDGVTTNPSLMAKEGIKGKELFMGTRVILTGQNHGPEIPKVLTLLGKDKLMVRLNQAKEYVLNEE